MLFALGLLASQGMGYAPWLWWTPPTHLSRKERLGLSTRRIVHMTREQWNDYESKQGYLPYEGGNDAYGYALRTESRRKARNLTPARRRTLEQIREASFRFGMACIALENTLAGGGTYAYHAPHWLFVHVEMMERALVWRWPARRETPDGLAKIRQSLVRYRELRTAPSQMLYEEDRVDLGSLHRFAALALRYEDELQRLSAKLPAVDRGSVDRFIVFWGKEYVAIRGSNEVVPRS